MLITLTTDFGQDDAFVAIMKGVIYNIAPRVKIVDLCHQIEQGNLIQAAYILKSSWHWFPPKTVHIVVVDPGVGSIRKPLAGGLKGHRFVGPDNGLLTAALNHSARFYEIANPRYFHRHVSSTFHGRDIFAPVGAWLAKGTALSKMGWKVNNPITLDLPQPKVVQNKISGSIVYIDHFGNLTSNIPMSALKSYFKVNDKSSRIKIGEKKIFELSTFYSQPNRGSIGAIINSWNMLEIFCNGGNAAKRLDLKTGAKITVSCKG